MDNVDNQVLYFNATRNIPDVQELSDEGVWLGACAMYMSSPAIANNERLTPIMFADAFLAEFRDRFRA